MYWVEELRSERTDTPSIRSPAFTFFNLSMRLYDVTGTSRFNNDAKRRLLAVGQRLFLGRDSVGGGGINRIIADGERLGRPSPRGS